MLLTGSRQVGGVVEVRSHSVYSIVPTYVSLTTWETALEDVDLLLAICWNIKHGRNMHPRDERQPIPLLFMYELLVASRDWQVQVCNSTAVEIAVGEDRHLRIFEMFFQDFDRSYSIRQSNAILLCECQ